MSTNQHKCKQATNTKNDTDYDPVDMSMKR